LGITKTLPTDREIQRIQAAEIMKFRYSPFDKLLQELEPANLESLREVAEGWYVEYKSLVIPTKLLAKSLSAFANQYGGWLFLGIQDDKRTLTAAAFPGLPSSDLPAVLQAVRNAAKDCLNPEVYYETRQFDGPIGQIGLPVGRSILVVRVPPGAETPYVHADGRIYRRVADSSDPKPDIDRSTLDRLFEKGERSRARLGTLVTKKPLISPEEKNNCYLHLSILSDPHEVRGDWYAEGFPQFAEAMKGDPLPLDNIFTRSGGFVARQTVGNNPYHRLLTWEFDRHCHSFITIPINVLSPPYLSSLVDYPTGEEFARKLESTRIQHARLLDLNILFAALAAVVMRHRTLVTHASIRGPFFVKAHLANVWRTVPFLDLPSLITHFSPARLSRSSRRRCSCPARDRPSDLRLASRARPSRLRARAVRGCGSNMCLCL
jgi:hypothetical protein